MDLREYRRKNVEDPAPTVQAVKLTQDDVDEIVQWCGGQRVVEHDALDYSSTFIGLNLETPLGYVRASEGDYILMDVDGNFHRRKPNVFGAAYEVVNVQEQEVSSFDDPFKNVPSINDRKDG